MAMAVLGGTIAGAQPGATNASGTFTLKGGATVQLVVAFRSDARIGPSGPMPAALRDTAVSRALAVTAADLARLEADHHSWWKDFWLRSYVSLPDSVLQNYYYGALYALGSADRAGRTPPGLYGPFVTTDYSSWGGRYYMNYNFQAAFYGVGSSNRLDWMKPLLAVQFGESAFQQNKAAAAGYQGVAFQRSFTPADLSRTPPAPRSAAAVKNPAFVDQKSNA